MVGFSYRSDGGVNEAGFMVDDIAITGYPLDGAEADAGWTFRGFRTTTGTEEKLYSHYYVAENRTYQGYDAGLKGGPYLFGYLDDPALVNLVDHFAYTGRPAAELLGHLPGGQPHPPAPRSRPAAAHRRAPRGAEDLRPG